MDDGAKLVVRKGWLLQLGWSGKAHELRDWNEPRAGSGTFQAEGATSAKAERWK